MLLFRAEKRVQTLLSEPENFLKPSLHRQSLNVVLLFLTVKTMLFHAFSCCLASVILVN
jgi:hypothetical protein